MQKKILLNAPITSLISRLGHTDKIMVADCGLPIPSQVERVDIALVRGVPTFMQTVTAVFAEMQVESVCIASEFKLENNILCEQFLDLVAQQPYPISVNWVSHDELKQQSKQCLGIIRTGENTAYANVIINAGVAF